MPITALKLQQTRVCLLGHRCKALDFRTEELHSLQLPPKLLPLVSSDRRLIGDQATLNAAEWWKQLPPMVNHGGERAEVHVIIRKQKMTKLFNITKFVIWFEWWLLHFKVVYIGGSRGTPNNWDGAKAPKLDDNFGKYLNFLRKRSKQRKILPENSYLNYLYLQNLQNFNMIKINITRMLRCVRKSCITKQFVFLSTSSAAFFILQSWKSAS